MNLAAADFCCGFATAGLTTYPLVPCCHTSLYPDPRTSLHPDPRTSLHPDPRTSLHPDPRTSLHPDPRTSPHPDPRTSLHPDPRTSSICCRLSPSLHTHRPPSTHPSSSPTCPVCLPSPPPPLAHLHACPFPPQVLKSLSLSRAERSSFRARLDSKDLAASSDPRTLKHLLLRAEDNAITTMEKVSRGHEGGWGVGGGREQRAGGATVVG